jgi:ABC-type multidrug transport system ATPase subunit
MDPKTRRRIWDFILSIKEERLILLTTHSMEEADALAEKIAIIRAGVCWHATAFESALRQRLPIERREQRRNDSRCDPERPAPCTRSVAQCMPSTACMS